MKRPVNYHHEQWIICCDACGSRHTFLDASGTRSVEAREAAAEHLREHAEHLDAVRVHRSGWRQLDLLATGAAG